MHHAMQEECRSRDKPSGSTERSTRTIVSAFKLKCREKMELPNNRAVHFVLLAITSSLHKEQLFEASAKRDVNLLRAGRGARKSAKVARLKR
jgi:hypothetical protein